MSDTNNEKKVPRKYTYDELEFLMSSYSQYAETYVTAYYEREIKLPSFEEWLSHNLKK